MVLDLMVLIRLIFCMDRSPNGGNPGLCFRESGFYKKYQSVYFTLHRFTEISLHPVRFIFKTGLF